MTELWTTIVKGQSMATFKPPRLLKLTNATLGIDNSDGRTMALLEFPRQNSIVSSFVCALTAGKDDHKLLDIVLDKDVEYRLQAKGPNVSGWHLISLPTYFLAEDIHPGATFKFTAPELRAPESNGDLFSAPANLSTRSTATNATTTSVVLEDGHPDTVDAQAKRGRQHKAVYKIKEGYPGPQEAPEAMQDSTVVANLKFMYTDENQTFRLLFEEKANYSLNRTIDPSLEEMYYFNETRVPASLATGREAEIKNDIDIVCKANNWSVGYIVTAGSST
ncbi:hypothetical protein B0H12DRAFT_1069923 [Mycena haematopus]|nr:hypothetical protein B0H12DRAFT_1069923 [Mycena haematopus]